MAGAGTTWGPEHFIGGHPALDLANTVFDRHAPAADNELLKSWRDLGNWFHAAGLADDHHANWISEGANEPLETVHTIREASFAIFDDLATGGDPAPEPLGVVMSTAATGLRTGAVGMHRTHPTIRDGWWREPTAVPGFLAMLTVHALFTLPTERIRSCPRCGWLFVDTSRGGQRRWCSMKTCGNREKVARHRDKPDRGQGIGASPSR